jgi:hypothetical protein
MRSLWHCGYQFQRSPPSSFQQVVNKICSSLFGGWFLTEVIFVAEPIVEIVETCGLYIDGVSPSTTLLAAVDLLCAVMAFESFYSFLVDFLSRIKSLQRGGLLFCTDSHDCDVIAFHFFIVHHAIVRLVEQFLVAKLCEIGEKGSSLVQCIVLQLSQLFAGLLCLENPRDYDCLFPEIHYMYEILF